ncbi:MAG: stage II sporulation protein M [Chloroflexi bacterium]|nr:stage II sporulation protein M [Chloroflexota bacterium]
MQNTRVLLAATILGLFTFGVLSVILVIVPFGMLGFIMGQVYMSSLSPLPFFLAVIPHGIVEIPIILIAGAAALRLGSIVTRPPDGQTVGEAWVRALADTVKLFVGVVIPGLILAGILEVVLTPRVVEWVLML